MPKDKKIAIEDGVKGWLLNSKLVEKVVMVSLLSIIFSTVLPGVQATNLEIIIAVALVVLANVLISHWLSTHKRHWRSVLRQFVVMSVVNFGLVMLYANILLVSDGSMNLGNTLFFALLLTLLVTLYDRYRIIYDRRFSAK